MNKNDVINKLLMPSWTAKDIKEYIVLTGHKCGLGKAADFRNEAITKYGGKVPYDPYKVKVESVLKMFGTSREQELLLLKSVMESDYYENKKL